MTESAFARLRASTWPRHLLVAGFGAALVIGLGALVPKGRDEDELSDPMEWVRIRDAYRD